MSHVVVVGGSVTGLATAAILSDRGHRVTLLERQADLGSVAVAAELTRPTVPQYVHSHAFASLCGEVLTEYLPDVVTALREAGCGEVGLVDHLPPGLAGLVADDEDRRLRMTLARRSTFENVLRDRALRRPGVEHRSGVRVTGLLTGGDGPARVTGVRTADGGTIEADVVVDASGRRSELGRWLTAAGLPAPVELSESCGIVYYTRHYRQVGRKPGGPLNRGFGAGGLWDHYTAVLFRGDADTFSISIGVLPGDEPTKGLKDPAAFTAAVAATPLLAGWLAPDVSVPVSGVHVMAGLDNAVRFPDPAVGPVAGLMAVGDSVCTTNPAYGRGVSLALAGVALLTETLTDHPEVDTAQAAAFWSGMEQLVRPWFDEARLNDLGRRALWQATVEGRRPGRPPAGVVTFGAAVAASTVDETVWRQVARTMMMLAPPASLYADPGVGERIGRALAGGPPPALPGATRDRFVAAIAAVAGDRAA